MLAISVRLYHTGAHISLFHGGEAGSAMYSENMVSWMDVMKQALIADQVDSGTTVKEEPFGGHPLTTC